MISHGFVSAAMFLCVCLLYDRMPAARSAYGGLSIHADIRAFMMLFAMANSGCRPSGSSASFW